MRSPSALVGERNGYRVVFDSFVPNPKQAEFSRLCDLPEAMWVDGQLVPYSKEILFHGAIRSGKSQAAGKKLTAWAMEYPGVYLACRSTLKELEDSTKRIMLDGDGVAPPAIPPELVAQRWDGEKNKVRLVNGAEIWFRSMEPDQRGKIRNITPAGALVDQIEELRDEGDEGFYTEFVGRMSDPHELAPRKVISVANPDTDEHWVCRRWGLTEETERFRQPGCLSVHVNIFDNQAHLHPNYFASLLATEHTSPDYFARMVLGMWGAFEGKRFKCWRKSASVYHETFDIPSSWEIIEGMDYGWENPFAILWFAIDYENQWWLVWEHFVRHRKLSDVARDVLRIRSGFQPSGEELPFRANLAPSATYLDPSCWATRGEYGAPAHELMDNGVYPTRASNERLGGWARLEEMLSEVMPDGYTRLRCFPCVQHFPREVAMARIKEGTDDIEKKDDHALDAGRYAVMSRWDEPEREPYDEPDDEILPYRRHHDPHTVRSIADWSERRQLLRAAQQSASVWAGE